eukprot:jgi/Chrpa1/8320/Chrysochromulina_OHIO_Genome00020137-RA
MNEDEGEGEVEELEPHLPVKVHTDTYFATSASATSASARNLAPSVELALQGSLDPKTEQWAHASTQQLERQQNVSPRMKRMQQLAEMRERGRELQATRLRNELQPTLEWVPELERLQEEKGEGERDALKLPAPDLFDAFGQLSQRIFGGSPEKATVRADMLDSVAEEEAPAAVEEEHAPEESAESADAVQLVAASITDVSSCTGGVDSMSATALVEAAPATTAFAPATEPPAVGTATRPSTALVVASYASAALTAATASFRGLRQTPRALEGKSARGSSFQVQVRLQPMSVDEDEGESDVLEPPVPVDPNADATDGLVAEATDSSQQERPDVLLALSERMLTPVAALDVFGQLSQRLFGGVNFGSPENATAPLERGSVTPRRGAGMAKLVSQTKAFQVAAAIKLQSMARGRAARRLAFLKRQRPTRAKRIELADSTWNPESPIATIRGLDPVAMIRQLKQLLDDGLITQEQFEEKRLEAKEQLRRAYKEGKIRV